MPDNPISTESEIYELTDMEIDTVGLVNRGAASVFGDGKNFFLLKSEGKPMKETELIESSVLSPAKAEKVLKKYKLALPENTVISVSTGNTLAPESDPRPAVLQIRKQLSAALGKLV